MKLGLKHYFTGLPCKHGHVAERTVSDYRCVECYSEYKAKWNDENRDRTRAHFASWRKRHPDEVRQRWAEWSAKNREIIRQKDRARQRANRTKGAARAAARYARKLQRTPKWVDRKAIDTVYAQAKLAEAVTGLPHHVDHIVPLQGVNVCGLHVPWNLQVLEASENIAKGNRFES